nr:hypothetical protein [Candidatus Dadabacteria bacterium]
MKKSLAIITLLLIPIIPNVGFGNTLTVGPGKNFASIQEAINEASCGDTVLVYADTYHENIEINRGCSSSTSVLTIQTAEPGVIIDGGGNDPCINIPYGNGIEYVDFDGSTNGRFTLQNCGRPSNNPTRNNYNGGGFVSIGNRNINVKGMNIISSGNTGAEDMDSENWAIGFQFHGSHTECTRPGGCVWEDITIDCSDFDNCFASAMNVEKTKNATIRNVKVIDSGSRYGMRIMSVEDVIFEKNYIKCAINAYDWNNSVSGVERVRACFRLRESEDVIMRYNVINTTGSSGMISCVAFTDEGEAIGFDFEGQQTENYQIYNNIFDCDVEKRSSQTEDNIGFWGKHTGVSFTNNIINVESLRWRPLSFHHCGSDPIELTNNLFSGNSNSSDIYYGSDCADVISSINHVNASNPGWIGSGNTPVPYYLP